MFKNILLPLDGSHSCQRATELAAVIAGKFSSKVTVMHVISHDFMHPELKSSYHVPPLVMAELDKTYEKAGEKIIRSAKEYLSEENIDVDTILERAADPAEKILQTAKKLNCDLLIMGNISEEQAFRFSLGSVAEDVALAAQCPVLIVKRKTEIGKLLVAFNSSDEANKALKYAVDLCKHFEGTSMTILNVENRELFRLEPTIAKEVGEQILNKAISEVEGVTCDRRLEFGKPANMILKTAELEDFDLIVLGSRSLSSIRRLLIGSVVGYVSMHAERSVLLVR